MDKFCLTALEAAEIFDLHASELVSLIHANEGVAIGSGDSWRVDPEALATAIDGESLKLAA